MRRFLLIAMLASASAASAAIPTAQRDALVAIHNATGGSGWSERANWLGAPGTECTWARVRCNQGETSVEELNLEQNNLRGALPAAIGAFPDLRILFLFDNFLEGDLPSSIGQLTKLEYLILDRNAFTGPIPPSIGQLTSLKLLHLDGNRFTSIPRELGNMRSLEQLDFSFNELEGTIPPEIGQLSNLRELEMAVNRLSGNLPREIGNLAKLERLGFTDNRLTGTIPAELANLTALQSLRIGYNQFEGTIPAVLGSLRSLDTLDLSANRLTGGIPRELGQLSSLLYLALAFNQLDGPIPNELYRLPLLEDLDLGGNRLSGTISPEIGNLRTIKRLSIGNNQLTGRIPLELTTLTNLVSLDALNNDFEGPIPQEIGRLTNLGYLDLAGNRFSGQIPSSVGQLTKLFFFSVYENQLEGPIPPEIGNLTELQTLYLTSNYLTGTIPESLRNLRKLESFYLGGNQLTGSIPEWIGELTQLDTIFFPGNRFTGSIPRSIGQLVNLESLYLGYNDFTGPIPREIGNLTRLGYLQLEWTSISGPIPDEFYRLTELVEVRMNDMDLTGRLSSAIGNLTKLNVFFVQTNHLDGPIPPEIGNLRNLQYLSLGANSFSGTIPPQIGQLDQLLNMDLYANALRGPVPPEIRNLRSLQDRGSDFAYNMLTAPDAATRQFMNQKQYDGDFEQSQTVTPANVRVSQVTDRSALLEWDLIRYIEGGGGYQVIASRTAGGTPVVITTTASKELNSIVVRGLDPTTTYFFTVSAVSHPQAFQQNLLVSDPSAAVSATTTARVVAPPDVVVTETTNGLIQVDSVPRNEDSFTLTNYGDTGTNITISQEGSFFTVEPQAFALAGGASQTVRVRSVPQPPGTYYGEIRPAGAGVSSEVYIGESLLSAARPTGTAIAEALTTRIDVAGAPGSDTVGQARFRNRGTALLTGIVLSDQPWVVPERDPVRIDPGQIGTVNFRVMRGFRPVGAEGSLTANLSLVYVDGATGTFSVGAMETTPGVSITLVTVVDTPKPPVSQSNLPSLDPGNFAYFASGIASFQRSAGRFVSDISILNANTARAISDLRIYFTPASGTTSVATIGNLATAQSLTLANVVTNVYGSETGVGTLQFRSASLQSLAAAAKLVSASEKGTFTGDVPVFRSDRSVAPGQSLYLTGVRKSSSVKTDLYLQETSGANLTARLDFLDANGSVAGSREVGLAGFAMSELLDAVPANAVTVVVTNVAGSSGRLAAYARLIDETSGDSWSIVDWGRYYRFAPADSVRVPFVSGATQTGGPSRKRRAVSHADAVRSATELTLFNPTANEVRATLQIGTSQREVAVGARRTMTIPDAGNSIFTPAVSAVVTPLRDGELVVSARTSSGAAGTSVPVIPAAAGLRLGQSQRFSGLSDSTAVTVAASKPGTFRTALGLVETSGAATTVRARVLLDEGRGLATSVIARDFAVGANQQLYFENLMRAIVGESRETALGELGNLQLIIEVVSGQGSIVPFVIATDNGTGDSLLRLE
jgi:Leucine-rich repeat (LRR) protein